MGFRPVAGEAPLDPLLTWPARIEPRCGASVGALCEATRVIPLGVGEQPGESVPAITHPSLAATHLSARFVLNRNFALALGVPLSGGASSLRIAPLIGVVPTESARFGFYVIPTLELPTRGELAYVGANAISGGGTLAVGYGWDRSRVDLNLGIHQTSAYPPAERKGYSELQLRLAAGHKPARAPALRAEFLLRSLPSIPSWPASSPPLELVLSARQPLGVMRLTFGGAAGFAPGVGALAYRGFVGIDLVYACPEERGPQVPGYTPRCLGGEVINGYLDGDGCPDRLATLVLAVEDTGGQPLRDVTVELDGERYRVDVDGALVLEQLMPWTYASLLVSAPGTEPRTLSVGPLQEGENRRTITLAGAVAPPSALQIPSTVLFEFDSDQLKPGAEGVLRELLAVMNAHPELGHITVLGHTDNTGSAAYNLDLSERRAEAVRAWLVQNGVDPARVSAEGRGEEEPLEPNDTPSGRAANRRVEVVLRAGQP